MKALSIRQPWTDAVLYGGKRIENRTAWRNCHYRGPLVLHAANGMTYVERREAEEWMADQGVMGAWYDSVPLARGAFVGLTEIVDVVRPGVYFELVDSPLTRMTEQQRWWMGGFALVFGPVRVFKEPLPGRGMLGLFTAPDEFLERPTW